MATKDRRFQLFLYGLHDRTAASAGANGVSLSTEVRNRVSRSFWQDKVIDAMFQLEALDHSLTDLKEFAQRARDEHLAEMEKQQAEYVKWRDSQ